MLALGAADAVALVGINHEGKILVQVLQLVDKLKDVLHVHVVIHGAVGDEELALEFVRMGHHRAGVITVGILLGGVHVALGIDAVVQAIVGDRVLGDTVREIVGACSHRQQGDITTITAAGDADAGGIDKGELLQPFDCGDIVMDLPFAEIAVHLILPLAAEQARAAVIHIENDDALLRCVEIGEHRKAIAHDGSVWPAVDLQKDRIFLGDVEVGR